MNFVPVRRSLVVIVFGMTCVTFGQTCVKHIFGSGFSNACTGDKHMSVQGTFGQALVGGVIAAQHHAELGFWTSGAAQHPSEINGNALPQDILLLSNSPNPFRDATTIQYHFATSRDVRFTAFSENGAEVARAQLGHPNTGMNAYQFNTGSLPTGTYRYTLTDGASTLSGALTIIK